MTDLTTAQKSEIDRWGRELTALRSRAGEITPLMLATLIYRREISSVTDGHAGNKRPKPGGGGGKLSATEAAALRGLLSDDPDRADEPDDWERHNIKDPQGHAIDSALALLNVAFKCVERSLALSKWVVRVGEDEKGRPTSVLICEICGGSVTGTAQDPFLGGMGSVCYQRWYYLKKRRLAESALPLDKVRWAKLEVEAINNGTRRRCGDPVVTERGILRIDPKSKPTTGIGGYEVPDIDGLQESGVLPAGRPT